MPHSKDKTPYELKREAAQNAASQIYVECRLCALTRKKGERQLACLQGRNREDWPCPVKEIK